MKWKMYSACILILCNMFSLSGMKRERYYLPDIEFVKKTMSEENTPKQDMPQQISSAICIYNTYSYNMTQICDRAFDIISPDTLKNKYTDGFFLKINACINFYDDMKRVYSVDEDAVGKFAVEYYKQPKVAIFFSFLKKYNTMVSYDNKKKRHFIPHDQGYLVPHMTDGMDTFIQNICQIDRLEESCVHTLISLLYTNKRVGEAYPDVVEDYIKKLYPSQLNKS